MSVANEQKTAYIELDRMRVASAGVLNLLKASRPEELELALIGQLVAILRERWSNADLALSSLEESLRLPKQSTLQEFLGPHARVDGTTVHLRAEDFDRETGEVVGR